MIKTKRKRNYKEYYYRNREIILKKQKERQRIDRAKYSAYNKQRRRLIKEIVLSHYSKGKPHCRVCGFEDIRALCLDHVENNGAEHRREINSHGQKCGSHAVYAWIRKNNFPSGFQVLCCNCNMIKEAVRVRAE